MPETGETKRTGKEIKGNYLYHNVTILTYNFSKMLSYFFGFHFQGYYSPYPTKKAKVVSESDVDKQRKIFKGKVNIVRLIIFLYALFL